MNVLYFGSGLIVGVSISLFIGLRFWNQVVKANDLSRETFASLSVDALRQISGDFVQLADATLGKASLQVAGDLAKREEALGALLVPIESALRKLNTHSEEMERRRVSAYDSLSEQVKNLSSEAHRLSGALRRPTIRGSWGELMLRTVCENAGLIEGVHFIVQDSNDGDGTTNTLRPDMVVKLPKKRVLILDSKVPLDAFRDAMDSNDEATRASLLKQHVKHVRDHIKKLSAKSYWSRYSSSPDCTIMCIPSEGAYYAAVENDPSIVDLASASNVIIANPMTLIAILRAVANVLSEERLAESALLVREVGRKLYESAATLFAQVQKLGKQIRMTNSTYNALVQDLSETAGQARELKELGAGSATELPVLSPVLTEVASAD
ncbi:MAG: DNA recombination protein RmuC [Fimbriimonadaceae bacterium]|nr:DNA recombination protein RmuC [Fimbriimonadaceae bacterium]